MYLLIDFVHNNQLLLKHYNFEAIYYYDTTRTAYWVAMDKPHVGAASAVADALTGLRSGLNMYTQVCKSD